MDLMDQMMMTAFSFYKMRFGDKYTDKMNELGLRLRVAAHNTAVTTDDVVVSELGVGAHALGNGLEGKNLAGETVLS